MSPEHSPDRFRGGAQRPPRGPSAAPFDPAKEDRVLLDTVAEEAAERLERVNSSQLRRFFGDVKDLSRQFEARIATLPPSGDEIARVYRAEVEPRFKMIRSKVNYARRAGAQSRLPDDFAQFLDQSIKHVGDYRQFQRFVAYFEAVVGFMYGKGKVSR